MGITILNLLVVVVECQRAFSLLSLLMLVIVVTNDSSGQVVAGRVVVVVAVVVMSLSLVSISCGHQY